MFYVGTRDKALVTNVLEAIRNPISYDGGLLTPSFIPRLPYDKINEIGAMQYADAVFSILAIFIEHFIPQDVLQDICHETYQDWENPIQLKEIDTKLTIMDLCSINPTFSVKDHGMMLSAKILDYLLKKENKRGTVVDISTGVSGCAAVNATLNCNNIDCFAIYGNKISNASSSILSKLLNTSKAQIITANCDTKALNLLRSELYDNQSFRELINMIFINDKNIINILSCVAFFFKAYLKIGSRPFTVSIPTNNMGLAFAAYIAQEMGIPIKKIILSLEKNDFLHDLHLYGKLSYTEYRSSISTLDAALPSNLERVLYHMYASNQDSVKRAMSEIYLTKAYKVNDNTKSNFNNIFHTAVTLNEFDITNYIYKYVREFQYFIHPALAVAILGYEKSATEDSIVSSCPCIALNTAHFSHSFELVKQTLGYEPEAKHIPWKEYENAEVNATKLESDPQEIARFITSQLNI